MALPNLDYIELQYLNLWFANLVDNINFNSTKIEGAVPALNMELTSIDTAPIQYLRDSLNKLVDNVNSSLSKIDERLRKIEANIAKGG